MTIVRVILLRRVPILILAAAAVATAILALGLWWYPRFELGRSAQENQYRKDAEQSLILVGGAVALLFTAWQVLLTRKGHFTDRFTKAVAMLTQTDSGKPLVEARIGALLALEHLADDSFDYRPRVLELVARYIRQNIPWDPPASDEREQYDPDSDLTFVAPRGDIAVAVQVLSRSHRFLDRKIDLSEVNLAGYRLQGLRLGHLSLRSSNLCGAQLKDADLRNADCTDVWLCKANLTNVRFDGAQLLRARLRGSNIAGAVWKQANVSDVDFTDTNISSELFTAKFYWEAHFDNSFQVRHHDDLQRATDALESERDHMFDESRETEE